MRDHFCRKIVAIRDFSASSVFSCRLNVSSMCCFRSCRKQKSLKNNRERFVSSSGGCCCCILNNLGRLKSLIGKWFLSILRNGMQIFFFVRMVNWFWDGWSLIGFRSFQLQFACNILFRNDEEIPPLPLKAFSYIQNDHSLEPSVANGSKNSLAQLFHWLLNWTNF